MTACNVKNVTLLADALEQGKIKEGRRKVGFNMNLWHGVEANDFRGKACGTVACIGGSANLLFGTLFSNRAAAESLGLSGSEASALFLPVVIGDMEWDLIPLAAAVEVLRHLAKTGEIDWPRAIKLHPLIGEEADA